MEYIDLKPPKKKNIPKLPIKKIIELKKILKKYKKKYRNDPEKYNPEVYNLKLVQLSREHNVDLNELKKIHVKKVKKTDNEGFDKINPTYTDTDEYLVNLLGVRDALLAKDLNGLQRKKYYSTQEVKFLKNYSKDVQNKFYKEQLKVINNEIDKVLNKFDKMGGGKKYKKKIRKHLGINQQTGRLKKGYKYSGKKLKSGLPQIIKLFS